MIFPTRNALAWSQGQVCPYLRAFVVMEMFGKVDVRSTVETAGYGGRREFGLFAADRLTSD